MRKRSIENIEAWLDVWHRLRPLLLFCLGLLVAILAIKVVYSIRQSRWQGSEPFRFLVIEVVDDGVTRVAAVNYLPDAKEVVIVNVPPAVRINAAGDYGAYRVDGLWKLGKIEGVKERLLAKSMEQAMAVFFDRVVVVNKAVNADKPINLSWQAEMMQRMFWQSLLFRGNVYDAARVMWATKGYTDAQIRLVDLTNLPVSRYSVDVDGAEIEEFDRLRLDDLMRRTIMPGVKEIAEKGIVVENATPHAGLASHWSRFMVIGGFDLVNVTDTTALRTGGALLFADEAIRDSLAGQILRRWFPDFLVVVTPLDEYRSDIVVRLGEESFERVHSKDKI